MTSDTPLRMYKRQNPDSENVLNQNRGIIFSIQYYSTTIFFVTVEDDVCICTKYIPDGTIDFRSTVN